MTFPLRDAFVAVRSDVASEDAETLERALAAAVARARQAWPAVEVPDDVFSAEMARRTAPGTGPGVDGLRVADLYLATACLRGDAHALRALEGILAKVGTWIGRVSKSPPLVDDVQSRLRSRLLVREGEGAPKLSLYSARGPLEGWLRVSAVRAALRLVKQQRGPGAVEPQELEAPGLDPELALLKRKYGNELHAAFKDALGILSRDQRNVLRLHYLDGLSIEDVGRTYKMSRATAARRLAEARAAIVAQTHEALKRRLSIDTAEADSLLAFVRSQLNPTLASIL